MYGIHEEWILPYRKLMELKDPKLDGFPMMESPFPMLLCVVFYILFVFQGSKWMANREPFQLKWIILVHNCLLILISMYIVGWMIFIIWVFGYSMYCSEWILYDMPGHPLRKWGHFAAWLVFFSRVLELSDTVFFILRKKFSQVTFLHVYHHALALVMYWFGVRFVPDGPFILYPLLNCSVHIFMYIYYTLASLGINLTAWKKYLTMLEISQLFVFALQSVIYQMYDCPMAEIFGWIVLFVVLTNVVLFLNFYHQNYVVRRTSNYIKENKVLNNKMK